ncbi:MAG: FtsX-like permease family protein, partial [Thermoanaerobaculia bacterium]
ATAFALLLITSNTLAMAARERRSEAALLRILGFQKSEVAGLLLLEAGLYGLLGALGGAGLMSAFAIAVRRAMQGTQLAPIGSLIVPTASILLLLLASSLLLATVAGLVPAIGLSRRSIVELLRETA